MAARAPDANEPVRIDAYTGRIRPALTDLEDLWAGLLPAAQHTA